MKTPHTIIGMRGRFLGSVVAVRGSTRLKLT
jgi:hypothetical protein